jgi:hypothetical protein
LHVRYCVRLLCGVVVCSDFVYPPSHLSIARLLVLYLNEEMFKSRETNQEYFYLSRHSCFLFLLLLSLF